MFDVPMQLIEEKKHHPSAPRKMTACEKCVYNTGQHTCSVESIPKTVEGVTRTGRLSATKPNLANRSSK